MFLPQDDVGGSAVHDCDLPVILTDFFDQLNTLSPHINRVGFEPSPVLNLSLIDIDTNVCLG